MTNERVALADACQLALVRIGPRLVARQAAAFVVQTCERVERAIEDAAPTSTFVALRPLLRDAHLTIKRSHRAYHDLQRSLAALDRVIDDEREHEHNHDDEHARELRRIQFVGDQHE